MEKFEEILANEELVVNSGRKDTSGTTSGNNCGCGVRLNEIIRENSRGGGIGEKLQNVLGTEVSDA